MLVGDYVESYEVIIPFQTLQMIGHTVHTICPDKHAGDSVATAIHGFEGAQTYSERPGHHFTVNATFTDVDPAAYDALVVSGGRAPEYLRLNARVLEVVRRFFQADKPATTICHGAQLLSAMGVLEDKACSAYPVCDPGVTAAGGTLKDIPVDQAHADGKLVTAPAWPAHPAWLTQSLEVLGTQILH